MKIALAQIDSTVADLRGNAEKIRAFYRRARGLGADLVLFPELSLPGYFPRDLLERPGFIRANLAALRSLAKTAGETGMVVGFAEENRERSGKRVRNSAALLWRGKVVLTRAKTLLPSYDVFDETRYFEPARANAPFPFKGRRLGLTICEDAWNQAGFWPRRLYAVDPVREQARRGARVLLNISASPFHRGKAGLRLRMLSSHASGNRLPLLHCGLTGGNDELVFDGASAALDARGRLIARAPSFREHLLLVDPDAPGTAPARAEEGIAQVRAALVLGIRDYARKCGFRQALVGLSGGIDSAVVCALAVEALGAGNVTGVSMPGPYSSRGSVVDARALAANLGVRLASVPITPVFRSMLGALRGVLDGTGGLTEQNLQARIRGSVLMALSNRWGALLLSTGNKSELSVGYCTLYGDMNGGLAAIGDVPKTTVYELARAINAERRVIPRSSIEKPPSAELARGQRDQDDLPPYAVLDDILHAYIERDLDAAAIARRGHPRRLVDDILRRVDFNEYKRRQAPPVVKITPKSFGLGRRMPIARGRA